MPILAWLTCVLGAQDNVLKPDVVVELQSSLGGLGLSADRSWLLLLDLSAGKLRRFDAAKAQMDGAEIALVPQTRFMAVTPDGKTAFLLSSSLQPNMGFPADAPPAEMQVVDVAGFKLRSKTALDVQPSGLRASDAGTAFISGRWKDYFEGIGWYATGGRTASRRVRWEGSRQHLRLSPDQKWIYTGIGAFFRFNASSGAPGFPANFGTALLPGEMAGGDFRVSPDGRHLVGTRGAVIGLTDPKKERNNLVARVEEHLVSAMVAELPALLFVSTLDGFLKVYARPSFELKTSYKLAAPLYAMELDAKARRLFGAAHTSKARELSSDSAGLGDLHVYALDAVLAELAK